VEREEGGEEEGRKGHLDRLREGKRGTQLAKKERGDLSLSYDSLSS